MFGKILTVLLVLTSINGWILDVNYKHVTLLLTPDVTIQCDNDDKSTQTINDLVFIRVSKFINKGWHTVASITPKDPVPKTSLIEANTTGYIENSTNSFLQIYFPVADQQTIGQYVCDIEGFNDNMDPISIKTEQVVITEHKVTYIDILEMLRTVKQKEKDDQSDWAMLKDTIVDLTKSISIINVHVKQIHDDLQKVTNEKNTMKAAIDNLTIMNNDQSRKVDDLKMYITNITTTQQDTVNNDVKMYIKNISAQQERVNNDQSQNMDDLKKYMSTSIKDITTKQNTVNNDQSKMMDDLKMYITNISTSQKTADNDQYKKIDDLNMHIINITTHQEMVDNDLKVYINNITTQQETIHKNMYDITSLITQLHRIYLAETWPTGKYSIPEPDKGCPSTPTSTWAYSSIRISTAPNNNMDSHSSNLNLAGNVFEKINNNNYATLKLCSMTGGGHGPVWPAGSYCVQVYSDMNSDDKDCPSGLHYGFTRYGRFYDNLKDVVVNLQGYDSDNTNIYTFIDYCCRNDSLPTSPIILPQQQPFYLYRFGGRCQEVVDMTVSDQWIHTDTGKWGIKDSYGYEYNPDGSITNGVTTQICYYKPRN